MNDADVDWLEKACLGGVLPQEAERHLSLAGLSYGDDEVAEAHLREAMNLAPDHAAVLIGFYRFYFYKGRLQDALGIALTVLAKAARDNKIAQDWRAVKRGDADFSNYAAILPRFYLFTLKGYAYLNMRLGEIEEGREAIVKLLELDPGDKVGAKVLLQVLNRMGMPEEDE